MNIFGHGYRKIAIYRVRSSCISVFITCWWDGFYPRTSPRTKTLVPPKARCSPASEGWVKVNTEGSTNLPNSWAGLWYMIWDTASGFVEVGCLKHMMIKGPFICKLLACREGIEAAIWRGLNPVLIQKKLYHLILGKAWFKTYVDQYDSHFE
jgi:hypothetical protein